MTFCVYVCVCLSEIQSLGAIKRSFSLLLRPQVFNLRVFLVLIRI